MAHRIEEPKGPEHVTWARLAVAMEGRSTVELAGWINERIRAAYQQGREDGAAEMPDLDGPEYNRLMNLLITSGREGLLLADMVKNKFGASARRRRGA